MNLEYWLKYLRTMAESDYLRSGCRRVGLPPWSMRKVPRQRLYQAESLTIQSEDSHLLLIRAGFVRQVCRDYLRDDCIY